MDLRYHFLICFSLFTFCNVSAESEGGRKNLFNRVIDGQLLSTEDEAQSPMVELDLIGNAICSGVMISPDLVLTAAHCLERKYVSIRSRYMSDLNNPVNEYIRAFDFWIHPQYKSNENLAQVIKYDLGLMRLQKPVHANKTIANLQPYLLNMG